MTDPLDVVSPDPDRLAAARRVATAYLERKKRWTRALFVIACLSEIGLFGAMFFFFDFSSQLYWFLFFGLTFVYSPLITFVFRNSFLIDRLYYRLLCDLKYGHESTGHGQDDPDADQVGRERAQSFLEAKSRWSTWLFVFSGIFEATFGLTMLWFMDFSSQLHWFLFFGFMGVYSPLIISTWRNAHMIDRVYYGLVDELHYQGRGPR
jgi:hypothetical protein